MTQLKTILAMIGLLAIGFAGGFFTHVQLTRNHLEQVRREATIPGFEDRLFRVIRANENQRKQLEPMVAEYAQRLGNIRKHVHEERKVILDSLRIALEPELSEQQKHHLERFMDRQINFRPPPPHERNLQRRKKRPH